MQAPAISLQGEEEYSQSPGKPGETLARQQ